MRAPSIATSPRKRGAPVPSRIVPPRITRSCMAASGTRATATQNRALVAHEQDTPAERPAARRRDRDARAPGDLALAALAPELHAGFVQEAEAVQAAGGELPAVRVERDLAVERDAPPARDEGAALAATAEAERLEPRHRDEGEAVVELRDVDVARAHVGALPEHRGGVAQRHRREVVEVVPRG